MIFAKLLSVDCSRHEVLVQVGISGVIVIDLILHRGFILSIEDNARATLLHVEKAAILMRCFAFTRLEVLEAVVEQNSTTFVVGYELDVISDVSADKSWGDEWNASIERYKFAHFDCFHSPSGSNSVSGRWS